jgi:very-short-patch-repair endonuclease
VAGHKVDAHWPDGKLVVELKSKKYHLNPKAFEVDPVRDADLQRAGQRVLQVTGARLNGAPDALYDHIMALRELPAYGAPATSVNTTMNAPKPRQ